MQARQVYMLVSLLQVDALEEDALEMLGLVWSLDPSRNLLSHSGILEQTRRGKNLITAVHTCHDWRESPIACSPSWTSTNVEKTLTYINRSKLSPLDVVLYKTKRRSCLGDTFLLAVRVLSDSDPTLSWDLGSPPKYHQTLCSPGAHLFSRDE